MLKRFIAIIIVLLVISTCVFSCSNPDTQSEKSEFKLEKQVGVDFKILQLTDIQIIDPNCQPYVGRLGTSPEIEKWADKEYCVFNLVRELVEETKPDYIVLTGDNVYGQFDRFGTNFKAFVKFMDKFKIPWSFVNGNHDGEYEIPYQGEMITCGKGMEWQAEYVKKYAKYCLYELGDEELGCGNYTVSLTENNKTVFSFTFLDSHGCIGYWSASINKAQCEWYESEINKINEKEQAKVPNFIFLHIPLYEYYLGMEALGFSDGIGVITEDGYPNKDGNFGKNCEPINYCNGDMWTSIKKLNSTVGVFAGHDHVNNSSITYDGVRLTFGTKTGIYDYYNADQQGGTLITISDGGNFSVSPVYKK